MKTRAVCAPLVVVLLAAPPRPKAGERAECLRVLDGATASVEAALRRFEARGAGDVDEARRVLAKSREARDLLDSTPVGGSCAPSRNEELIYLNHLLLGFDGWLAARSRRPPADYDLASIVERGRTHRERGRARLR